VTKGADLIDKLAGPYLHPVPDYGRGGLGGQPEDNGQCPDRSPPWPRRCRSLYWAPLALPGDVVVSLCEWTVIRPAVTRTRIVWKVTAQAGQHSGPLVGRRYSPNSRGVAATLGDQEEVAKPIASDAMTAGGLFSR
jgi:hypothetical protein